MSEQHFSATVATKLAYYVYRLVDPRNGQTFYVGKGKGNRVFDHAKMALKYEEDEDELTEKIQTIRDIRDAGLEPMAIIHRHGMDGDTALEVEAALIDAYPGLTNLKSGINSDHGVMHAREIISRYEAPVADFSGYEGSLLIKITQGVIDERGSVYEAVRSAWRLNRESAEKAQYVFAACSGIIKGVFRPEKWQKLRNSNRILFTGTEAAEEIAGQFRNRRLPEQYVKRGAANPATYIK